MSARSSSTSTRPAQSRTVVTGGVSTVDAESMKYSWLSGMVTMWSSSSSVTLAKPEPSRPTRHTVRRYGSSSTSPEAVKYTTRSASSTCRICRTAHCPEVTCPSSAPVRRSYRYRWPQPSRWEYHSTSPASTRTIGGSVRPLVGLDAGGPGLAEHRGDLAGRRFQPMQGERAQVAGLAEVVHRRAVLRPPRPLGHDRRHLRHEQRLGLCADHRALGDVQHDQLGLGQLLVPGIGVPLGAQQRARRRRRAWPPRGGSAGRCAHRSDASAPSSSRATRPRQVAGTAGRTCAAGCRCSWSPGRSRTGSRARRRWSAPTRGRRTASAPTGRARAGTPRPCCPVTAPPAGCPAA